MLLRFFVAIVLGVFVFSSAGAWPVRGGGTPNNNRVTINVDKPIGYANLAKGFGFVAIPGNADANGFPITTPASSMGSNPSMPARYFDSYVVKHSGQAKLQIVSSPPMVVAASTINGVSSTVLFELGAATGDIGPGNKTFCGSPCTQANNPRVEFFFGWNIQSISNNGSGLIRINTKTNFVNSICWGQSGLADNGSVGPLVKIANANVNTGANATWAITNCTASSFDLAGSTFTNAQAGAAGTAAFSPGNMSVQLLNSGTYSGFTSLVWCRTTEETAVDNGQLISDDFVAAYRYMVNPSLNRSTGAWLRYMDFTNVQSSVESDFDERLTPGYITYSGTSTVKPNYYVGTITNGGSDNYTASNPAHSGTGACQDQEILQGIPSATNTGGLATLSITGRASCANKPIIYWNDNVAPIIIGLSAGAPSPGTDVLQYTFSATWLNGGVPVVVNYSTVAGDGTLSTLSANLMTALSGNATLSSNRIYFSNPINGTVNAGPFVYQPSAQAGRLTVTYSSGPAISSIYNIRPSRITAGSTGTFVFNYLADAWIYRNGGLVMSAPMEAAVELANRTGAHVWWNWAITKGSMVTATTQFFGDSTTGLLPGLKFGGEVANELWNFAASPTGVYQGLGAFLGIPISNNASLTSYGALRTAQFAELMKTAWAGKGRAASDLYVFSMRQTTEQISGNWYNNWLLGTQLNSATNSFYAAYGGLNGSGAPTAAYNTFPTRPVDYTTAVGQAPYWGSRWFGNGSSFTSATSINGTVGQNAPWLQAAKDYANGLTTTAFSSLIDQFTGVTGGAPNSGTNIGPDLQTRLNRTEAIAAAFDGARPSGYSNLAAMDYEAGPSFGIVNDGNNGLNSLSNALSAIATCDINALALRMGAGGTNTGCNTSFTGLNWDVSPYTISGTNDRTEMSQMVLQMLQGWKFDVDKNGVAVATSSYKNMIKTWYYQATKTTSAAREAKPAQFGVAADNWGWQPSDVFGNTPYKNQDAIREWNTGGWLLKRDLDPASNDNTPMWLEQAA